MKIHQIITQSPGNIQYRNASCQMNCEYPGHELKEFSFNTPKEGFKGSGNRNNEKAKTPTSKPKVEFLSRDNSPDIKITDEKSKITPPKRRTEDKFLKPACSRSEYFDSVLYILQAMETFDDIFEFCSHLQLPHYEIRSQMPSIMTTGLCIDEKALGLYPPDVPNNTVTYPVSVTGDGNCLPYTGSILAFGTEQHGKEMRVRIVIELTLHKEKYLSNEYLQQGVLEQGSKNLPQSYAMSSEKYLPGISLQANSVKDIYQSEVIDACMDKRYMGI